MLRRVGGPLGPYLAYMPDGEIGDRRYWIDGIAYRVFNGHPEIETLRRPAPDANGVESWRPLGMHGQFQFRVRLGVAQVRFGDPGWRLGYTKDAVSSHFVFRQLQKEGVIPQGVRFQVCLPLTFIAIGLFFPDPGGPREGGTRRHRRVPRRGRQDGRTDPAAGTGDPVGPRGREPPCRHRAGARGAAAAEALAARLAAPAADIAPAIPQQVALGYHGCFGTLSGWPSRQPPDFAPLERLRAADAKVYLGAIHHMHDADGLRRQLQTARRHLAQFGLAAPCGFGRAPERPGRLLTAEGSAPPPDILDIIVRDHRNAVELLHEAAG